jgi:hypothetical protein
MNAHILDRYKRFRATGADADYSLRAARILDRFEDAENDGLVRIVAEPEMESYFDVYGEPEGYVGQYGRRVSAEQERKELTDTFERDGLWCIKAEYRSCEKCGTFETSDSIGMNAGYQDPCSPFENCYVIDLMSAALEAAGR